MNGAGKRQLKGDAEPGGAVETSGVELGDDAAEGPAEFPDEGGQLAGRRWCARATGNGDELLAGGGEGENEARTTGGPRQEAGPRGLALRDLVNGSRRQQLEGDALLGMAIEVIGVEPGNDVVAQGLAEVLE